MSGARLAKGTTVVNLADGTKLGSIDHVYLDPHRKEIVGFTFHRGGLFGGGASGVVEVGDVHAFGPDAVTIDGVEAIGHELAVEARADDLVDLGTLLGRTVITEGGAILGKIAAVHFGEESHRLLAIDVSPGPFQERSEVPGEAVVNIGTEMVVVADAPAPPVAITAAAPDRLFYVVDATDGGRPARTG